MDLARCWVYTLGQGVDVGAEQLLHPSVVEQLVHDWVFAAQLLEHLLARAVEAGLRFLDLLFDTQMLEKHGANLPRRVDVELYAGQRVDLFLQAAERCVHCVGRLPERLRVERDAGLFHLCKDGHEGHLNVVKELFRPVFHEQWAEVFHQLPRYVRIFGRVLTNVLHRHFTHRALPLTARPDERLDGDGAITEIGLGEVIHVVTQLGVEQVVGDHRVEEWAVDTDAVFD